MRLWSRRAIVLQVLDPNGHPLPRIAKGLGASRADNSRVEGWLGRLSKSSSGLGLPHAFITTFHHLDVKAWQILIDVFLGRFVDRVSRQRVGVTNQLTGFIFERIFVSCANLNIHLIRRCPESFRLCIQFSGSLSATRMNFHPSKYDRNCLRAYVTARHSFSVVL